VTIIFYWKRKTIFSGTKIIQLERLLRGFGSKENNFCFFGFFFDFTFIGVAAEVQEYVEEPWQFVATPM